MRYLVKGFITRPTGQQFLGVCIVEVTPEEAEAARLDVMLNFPWAGQDAEWIGAASRRAHALGCNPGGEMAAIDITDAPVEERAKHPVGVLLSRADLEAQGAELVDPFADEESE